MDRKTLHHIFSRFQNVNLLALREDIKRGQVARDAWHSNVFGNHALCPAAHGVRCSIDKITAERRFAHHMVSFDLGITPAIMSLFTRFWDWHWQEPPERSSALLLSVLDEIWAERLADAECVQAIISQEPVTA